MNCHEKKELKRSKVLIIEPNPYHTEILPGIVFYFEKLGYIVDVYIRQEVINENVFARYKISGQIRAYKFHEVKSILLVEQNETYEYIFFSSMEHCENGQANRFLDEIGEMPKAKKGILGIYHNTTLIDRFSDYELLEQGRLFCISAFQKQYDNIGVMSPTWFGKINQYHLARRPRTLLLIGNSNDFSILSKGYWQLGKKERKELKFYHIGQWQKQDSYIDYIYREYKKVRGIWSRQYRDVPNLVHLGRLNFESMYEQIEKNDFILVLINPDNDNQKQYVSCATSGIRQLILGFHKPCIMHQRVAEAYGFPENSYISFENDISEALLKALEIEEEEYKEMINVLRKTNSIIEQESLHNLKKAMEVV